MESMEVWKCGALVIIRDGIVLYSDEIVSSYARIPGRPPAFQADHLYKGH